MQPSSSSSETGFILSLRKAFGVNMLTRNIPMSDPALQAEISRDGDSILIFDISTCTLSIVAKSMPDSTILTSINTDTFDYWKLKFNKELLERHFEEMDVYDDSIEVYY